MESERKPNRGPQKTYLIGGKQITECQMRIIGLNIRGLYRKEMAVALNVKEATIDSHFNRIYKLLGLTGSTLLAVWALSNGFNADGEFEV